MRYFISLLAFLALAVSANEVINDNVGAKVMTGEYLLECNMYDGLRVIDHEKITGTLNGKWTFKDGGYASNCKVIKGESL